MAHNAGTGLVNDRENGKAKFVSQTHRSQAHYTAAESGYLAERRTDRNPTCPAARLLVHVTEYLPISQLLGSHIVLLLIAHLDM